MNSSIRHAPLALVLIVLVPALLLAQKKKDEDANMRSVQGVVTDAGGTSVPGAVVQLKNTKTLQIRSFITKEQGAYFFNSLSPDVDYELHAMFSGSTSATKTLSSFDGRKQANINLKLDK